MGHSGSRFLAGALGAFFLPTRSGLHTDIVTRWSLSPDAGPQGPILG